MKVQIFGTFPQFVTVPLIGPYTTIQPTSTNRNNFTSYNIRGWMLPAFLRFHDAKWRQVSVFWPQQDPMSGQHHVHTSGWPLYEIGGTGGVPVYTNFWCMDKKFRVSQFNPIHHGLFSNWFPMGSGCHVSHHVELDTKIFCPKKFIPVV